MSRTAAPYRLVRTAPPPAPPLAPDEAQRRVIDHAGGPLLVLAGPGTGKTTTLVEAVAQRVDGGLSPDQVLVLTFSRRAAQELRERVGARLGGRAGGGVPAAWTFHAWCYAFVRAEQSPTAYADPLRLLSAPEQDVALRELLLGSLDVGRPRWPVGLRGALGTRGLAEEVRALFARAREVGMEPADLADLAVRCGRDDWAALAEFFDEYLDVLDAQGAVDYAELVSRAGVLAERPEAQAELRRRYRAVFVDEYQDTDPAQERLLAALAGGGGDLTVVGDPDQAIYAFRGAEVAGLLDFPERFRQAGGRPAEVVALRTCRRSAPDLLAVSRRVVTRITAPGLPVARLREHRAPLADAPADLGAGEVDAITYPSTGAEAEAIADLLRREHLERGTSWDRMAVLVRSGTRSVPLLRRVLISAGVPIEVAGDEVPLAREPAVAPLLLALRVVADPAELTGEVARLLLLSSLGGAEPAGLRRLGRALRALERERLAADPDAPSRLPSPSAQLVRDAVADPRELLLVDPGVAGPARRLAELLVKARAALLDGGAPEDALWELWSGSPWPRRLDRAATRGGAAGRAADRDLDAVVALFAAVARASERRGQAAAVAPLLDELEAQQIPGDTLADRGTRGAAVRLLTAHRSKGLEWDVVVVCGVQDGVWPDLRRRYSLLEAERLDRPSAGGLREPSDRTDLLIDERRLFYVALTRARRRLVVTAVEGTDEEGERPSRLLEELGVPITRVRSRGQRPLSLPALVARLRLHAVDPAASPAVRQAAADRLARLAAAVDDDGVPLVPAAHPQTWWGLADTTAGAVPVQRPGDPVALSGTSLSSLDECPLRWFLEHEAHARTAPTAAMGFGGVVHALAHEVADGRTQADLDALVIRLDTVWGQLAYEAPWQSVQQRQAAMAALERFLHWHVAARDRTLVATEIPFVTDLAVGGQTVRLRGFLDRVELDRDGRVHVVDLKTGKNAVAVGKLARHAQLGVYQLAIRAGALDDPDVGTEVGGAELVMLRIDERSGGPKVQSQDPLPDGPEPTWVEDLIGRAVQRVLGESFSPLPGPGCERCPYQRCCPARPEGRQVVE